MPLQNRIQDRVVDQTMYSVWDYVAFTARGQIMDDYLQDYIFNIRRLILRQVRRQTFKRLV